MLYLLHTTQRGERLRKIYKEGAVITGGGGCWWWFGAKEDEGKKALFFPTYFLDDKE
jgi:hypothetical protein